MERTTLRSNTKVLRDAEIHTACITAAITMLNSQWDLGLQIPNPSDSPSGRKERGKTVDGLCVHRIRVLQFKDRLQDATDKFRQEAKIMYQGWVHKPRTERGVVPIAERSRPHPVSPEERVLLLDCLSKILGDEVEKIPSMTPSSFARQSENLNDSPIRSYQQPKSVSQLKRQSDDFQDINIQQYKKQKQPECDMPPPSNRLPRVLDPEKSMLSEKDVVFSPPASLRGFDSNETQTTVPDEEWVATQPNSPPSPTVEHLHKHPQSSNYGSSSFEDIPQNEVDSFCINATGRSSREMKDDYLAYNENPRGLSDTVLEYVAEDFAASELYDRLKDVFPKLHPSLESLPMAVLYEITRVCLHSAVPMKDFQIKLPRVPSYDTLWDSLRKHPLLQDKPFPPRCQKDVWDSAMSDFKLGKKTVVLAGNLAYALDSAQPFYQFRLEPMKSDQSFRLGRRHGNDRFFEVDFPQMSHKKTPVVLQKLGSKGRELLISWLIDGVHKMFSRTWKPFHVKPKDRRGRKVENRGDEEFDTAHRVFLFAVDGHGFTSTLNPLRNNPRARQKMSVEKLLNTTRPIRENAYQTYLKLFARSDLVVSKNTPTVLLTYDPDPNRSQIIYMEDIEEPRQGPNKEELKPEVMTDGAGQMSFDLASAITAEMGLSTIPSGFQGRIGEAKGFWSVDYLDRSCRVWIKVYRSQRKWTQHTGKEAANHESDRTFEVLRYSSPLKAADLNLQFLPLLQDRAINPREMETTLKDLLQEGLQRRLLELQVAMTTPQGLRQWLKGSAAGDRLKYGCVPYRGGLPTSIEERLNLFLDAGFDANKLGYIKELARTAFSTRCDELRKRLNITVSKSTYVYMVPDFSGVLEPDEVYLDFSSFVDESTGLSNSNFLHNGTEMLVARSPAHYISDIQKVKIVHKVELMGLKDVIVFSTKGEPSLAAKLSGGDYDGDIAWACWEPTIVNNFQNANIPTVPNLVKEGLIKQSSVKYRDLVKDCPPSQAASLFLNQSFAFNMQQSMLGICTSFKESLCYTMGNVHSKEAVYLSTLLSSLVDQAKQGYTFTDDDWENFKRTVIKQKITKPSYKTDQINPRSKHIIDRLMTAADTTIKKLLTEFQQNTGEVSDWDNDLVICSEWLKNTAKTAGETSDWHALYENLMADINEMKNDCSKKMSFCRDEKSKDDFLPKCDQTFEKYLKILPRPESALSQALLPSCFMDKEDTFWALLRASALFASFGMRGGRGKPRTYVWHIAGRQLARLKSLFGGMGFAHMVTPTMYAMMKPDAGFVKKIMAQRDASVILDENSSVVNADEIAGFED